MRQVRKPQFAKIFLQRIWIMLAIVVIICIGLTAVMQHFYTNEQAWDFQSKAEQFSTSVTDKYASLQLEGKTGQELKEAFKQYLQWSVDTSSFGGSSAYAVYDVDAKELYAMTGKNVYLVCHEINGLEGTYRYDGRDSSAFDSLYKKMSEIEVQEYEKDFPFSNEHYDYAVDSVYVSDHFTFIPGKVRLVKYDNLTNEELETILEVEVQDGDVPGYTYVTIDRNTEENRRPGLHLFGFRENEARDDLEAIIDETIADEESEYSDLDSEYRTMTWSGEDGKYTIALRNNEENNNLVVVSCGAYDFWKLEWLKLIKIYAILAVIGIFLAIVWATYTYKMKTGYYELDRYRKRTTDILAHDLKTPLMAISGYTENLTDQTHPEKTEYYLQSIQSNVDYMNELIEKVLSLGRVEEEPPVKSEEVKISRILEKLEEQYEDLLRQRELHLEIQGDGVLQTDELLFTQILDNLLSNAVKYALSGTVIDIDVNPEKMTVRNYMEREITTDPEKLLQPFVKGDESRTGTTGTGLGLTIVSYIAQLLGYQIHLSLKENEFIAEVTF